MKGGVYTDERCPECGARLTDNHRDGTWCPEHRDRRGTRFEVRVRTGKTGEIHRRFRSYEEATRFLTGIRYEHDRGTFDARDYQSDNPNGFRTLAFQWLATMEGREKKHYRNASNTMVRAITAWGNRSIKAIGYAELEDFLLGARREDGAELAGKTVANMRSVLHTFWTWLRKRRVLRPDQVPEFPEVKFKLGYRNLVDKPTQLAIIEEVRRLTYHKNPKVWLAINWLSTYIAIRPKEILALLERDVDTENGYFLIRRPKEGGTKWVPMLEEDRELVRGMTRGFSSSPFFRACAGERGVAPEEPFGLRRLYKWWKRACANLGVEGVDLYGGTRHSSATALRAHFSPEQIKSATMHATNVAFERYFQTGPDDLKDLYAATRAGHTLATPSAALAGSNLLIFKK
jgi:integrase